MEQIGAIGAARRYPVKSMSGEDLPQLSVAFAGVTGDRVYAFVDPDKPNRNFPWLTAREVPELLLFKPRFVDPPDDAPRYPPLGKFRVVVTTPEGESSVIDDPEFLNSLRERWKRNFELRFSERGMQDAFPVSIFNPATARALGEEAGVSIDRRQFRANLYVEFHDPSPFCENGLVGKTLRVGEKLTLAAVKEDPRCVIINLDPETAAAREAVLNAVVKNHGGKAGIYAAVVTEGIAKVGDPVYLL